MEGRSTRADGAQWRVATIKNEDNAWRLVGRFMESSSTSRADGSPPQAMANGVSSGYELRQDPLRSGRSGDQNSSVNFEGVVGVETSRGRHWASPAMLVIGVRLMGRHGTQ